MADYSSVQSRVLRAAKSYVASREKFDRAADGMNSSKFDFQTMCDAEDELVMATHALIEVEKEHEQGNGNGRGPKRARVMDMVV